MLKNKILLYILLTIWTTIISGQTSWTAWSACEPLTTCFRRREVECTYNNQPTRGLQCLEPGDTLYEQIALNGCNLDCIENDEWVSPQTTQSCEGNCYDATQVNQFRCEIDNGCRLREYSQCYKEETCTDIWTTTGAPTECSASCGGGTQSWNAICRSATGGPSYNCNGTGGVINKVSKLWLPCNTFSCDVTWSSWTASGNCSKECGGGMIMKEAKCIHVGSDIEATTCDGSRGLPNRTRLGDCNTQSCGDGYGEWSPWSTCNDCSGNRTRERMCSSCAEGNPEVETESCSCSFATATNCTLHPCSSWGSWQITESCSCENRENEIRKRDCLSTWTDENYNEQCPDHLNLTTKGCEAAACSSILNEPFFIPTAAGAGVLLLICIVIIIACFMRKRKNRGTQTATIPFKSFETSGSLSSAQTSEASSCRNSTRTSTLDSTTPLSASTKEKQKDGRLNLAFDSSSNYAEIVDDKNTKSGSDCNSFKTSPQDGKTEQPKQSTGGGERNSVAYTSMHNMIDPAYTSLRPEQVARHGSLASRIAPPNDSDNELWDSSSGSEEYSEQDDALSQREHVGIPNVYGVIQNVNFSDQDRNRSSTNISGNGALMYSTIDSQTKATRKITVKKKSRKSKRKSRKNEFTRSVSARGSTTRLRASTRTPAYPAIHEDLSKISPSHEEYEIMKRNTIIESFYENNGKDGSTIAPVTIEGQSTIEIPGPPPISDTNIRSPMPIPRKSVKRINLSIENNNDYAGVEDEQS